MHYLLITLLRRVKIRKLYRINVDQIITKFQDKVRVGTFPLTHKSERIEKLTLIPVQNLDGCQLRYCIQISYIVLYNIIIYIILLM